MGSSFHTDSADIHPIGIQHDRLVPVRTITDKGIPCVVWGEDALAFAHCVPTSLFTLQILVPDHLVSAAVNAVLESGDESGFEVTRRNKRNPMDASYVDPVSGEIDEFYPASAFLRAKEYGRAGLPIDHPFPAVEDMYIHPQSTFFFDTQDPVCSFTRSPPLDPSYTNVRFPTRPAFMDSLIATYLEMPRHNVHHLQMLEVHIDSLWMYTLRTMVRPRKPDGTGMLPEAEALVAELRPENRPFLRRLFMSSGGVPVADQIQERRDILAMK